MSVFHSLKDVKYGIQIESRTEGKVQNNHARSLIGWTNSCPNPPWSAPENFIKKKSNQINESRLTLLTGLLRFDSQLLAYLVRSVYPLLLSLKSCKGAEILSVTDCLLQRGAALCALRGLLAHWRTAAWQQRDKEGDPTSLQRRGVGRYEAV